MKYKMKLKMKYCFYCLLSILDLVLILGVGYLADRLIEMVFTIIGFFVLRPCYEKQFHASTLIRCSIISLIIMGIVSIANIPKTYSILSAIIMSFGITWISYFVRDYIDLRIVENQIRKTKLEDLTFEQFTTINNEMNKDDLKIVYDYIHRDRATNCDKFLMNRYISRRTLFRLLKKVKENYNMRIE